jgi:hypothetical protein
LSLKKFVKDPNARLDYTIDWSAWLAPNGDTISNAVVASSTTGITPQSTTWTTTQTTTWVTGGTAGTSYNITVRITTTGGRQDDRTITIVCKEL